MLTAFLRDQTTAIAAGFLGFAAAFIAGSIIRLDYQPTLVLAAVCGVAAYGRGMAYAIFRSEQP